MDSIGLRELRQDASALVRRVQAGESFTVTVQGRPAAQLVPVPSAAPRRQWVTFDDVADLLTAPPIAGLAEDLVGLDDTVRDPFESRPTRGDRPHPA
jgi:prevent-host-death family protein